MSLLKKRRRIKIKCQFRKKCPLYRKDSAACNETGGMKDDGEWYCGKAREFASR